VGVKLCECLALLEANVSKWNGLARLCLVYSKIDRPGAAAAVARIKQLLRRGFNFFDFREMSPVFSSSFRIPVGSVSFWASMIRIRSLLYESGPFHQQAKKLRTMISNNWLSLKTGVNTLIKSNKKKLYFVDTLKTTD
jgi:hypothetical protein